MFRLPNLKVEKRENFLSNQTKRQICETVVFSFQKIYSVLE